MPELTVAMPAYNRADYIGEALASVLCQRGVDFEVIVVDDGSEDGTAGLVESLRERKRHRHRKQFGHADFILTNSKYNEAYIRTLLGEHVEVPVHVIYEGLELKRFPLIPRPDTPEGPLTILTVARLIEKKGLVFLLKACRLLLDRGLSLRCVIVGAPVLPDSTDYYLSLKKLQKALALEDVVTFLGAQPFDEVMAHYRRADLFVLPCVEARDGGRDVTPNALMEAMALELPVISTSLSAIPEIVEDGVSGLLVPRQGMRMRWPGPFNG